VKKPIEKISSDEG